MGTDTVANVLINGTSEQVDSVWNNTGFPTAHADQNTWPFFKERQMPYTLYTQYEKK